MRKFLNWIFCLLGLKKQEVSEQILPEPEGIIEPPKMKPPKPVAPKGVTRWLRFKPGPGMPAKKVTQKPYPKKSDVRRRRKMEKIARRITEANKKHARKKWNGKRGGK